MPIGPKLDPESAAANMADIAPRYTPQEAIIEANRCLFCFDAPCIQACPTGIDIPSFIKKIATGNLTGSARVILSANILGGSCARVCPTEVLCEGACVVLDREGDPVKIGRLQRYATDHALQNRLPVLKTAARKSGRRVAVIGGMRMVGFNNIELISDRSVETNFREIYEVKQRWPDCAVIASLMVDTRERWHEFVKRSADAGADGIELNFGCPHGMCERGMGSAVGQQPPVTEKIVGWVMEAATTPVIVKLTPNITDVTYAARAARKGGANAISLINTLNSITQVNLDNLVPEPYVGGLSSHGGYCGPAVKPIALNMVQRCAADPEVRLPISGIGGISNWRDAAEFIALGSTSVQVCTAIMHYGFRIVEDMIDGLNDYLDAKGFKSVTELVGKAVPAIQKWESLDLNYKRIARINYDKCIGCNLCYIACEDGAHQCIDLVPPDGRGLGPGRVPGKLIPQVREADCVGCNLCSIVCPVDDCIAMVSLDDGQEKMSWSDYQGKIARGEMKPIPAHP